MTCARYGVHMPNLGRGRTDNLLFRKDVCDRTGRKKMLTMILIAVVDFNVERVILS